MLLPQPIAETLLEKDHQNSAQSPREQPLNEVPIQGGVPVLTGGSLLSRHSPAVAVLVAHCSCPPPASHSSRQRPHRSRSNSLPSPPPASRSASQPTNVKQSISFLFARPSLSLPLLPFFATGSYSNFVEQAQTHRIQPLKSHGYVFTLEEAARGSGRLRPQACRSQQGKPPVPTLKHQPSMVCYCYACLRLQPSLTSESTDRSSFARSSRPRTIQDQAWLGGPHPRHYRAQDGRGDAPTPHRRRRHALRLFLLRLRSSIPINPGSHELPSQGTLLLRCSGLE